jgi:hypothetical protein
METVSDLRSIGYVIEVRGEDLYLTYTGDELPNATIVRCLVSELREKKLDAIKFLRAESTGTEAGPTVPLGISLGLAAVTGHPAYRPGLPMRLQTEEVEELWAKETFAGLGRPDPGEETKP